MFQQQQYQFIPQQQFITSQQNYIQQSQQQQQILAHRKVVGKFTFNFQDVLGKGSYATVFLGQDETNGQQVAIKVIHSSKLIDQKFKKHLRNEIEIMKSIKHENIVGLLDITQTINNIYIVQEFCNNGDLRKFMMNKYNKLVPEIEATFILKEILQGFQELIKYGVIHRDIKPENILINNGTFKIADFGFAKVLQNFEEQLLQSALGTPLYMAPQLLEHLQYSTKSDRVLYFELLFGQSPWSAQTQCELLHKIKTEEIVFPSYITISDLSKDFILKCLVVNETQRMSWDQVYLHELFQQYFKPKNYTFDEESYKLQLTINEKIFENKVQIQDLIKQFNQKIHFNAEDFHQMISQICPDILKENSEHFFHQLNPDQEKFETIPLKDIEQFLWESHQDYVNQIQEKEKIQMCEQQQQMDLIDIFQNYISNEKFDRAYLFKNPFQRLYWSFKPEKVLKFEDFEEVAQKINNNIYKHEIKWLFQMLEERFQEQTTFDNFIILVNELKQKFQEMQKSKDLNRKSKKLEAEFQTVKQYYKTQSLPESIQIQQQFQQQFQKQNVVQQYNYPQVPQQQIQQKFQLQNQQGQQQYQVVKQIQNNNRFVGNNNNQGYYHPQMDQQILINNINNINFQITDQQQIMNQQKFGFPVQQFGQPQTCYPQVQNLNHNFIQTQQTIMQQQQKTIPQQQQQQLPQQQQQLNNNIPQPQYQYQYTQKNINYQLQQQQVQQVICQPIAANQLQENQIKHQQLPNNEEEFYTCQTEKQENVTDADEDNDNETKLQKNIQTYVSLQKRKMTKNKNSVDSLEQLQQPSSNKKMQIRDYINNNKMSEKNILKNQEQNIQQQQQQQQRDSIKRPIFKQYSHNQENLEKSKGNQVNGNHEQNVLQSQQKQSKEVISNGEHNNNNFSTSEDSQGINNYIESSQYSKNSQNECLIF